MIRSEFKRPYCAKPGNAFSLKVGSTSTDDAGAEVMLHIEDRSGVRRMVTVTLGDGDPVPVDGIYSDLLAVTKGETNGTIEVQAETLEVSCWLLATIAPMETEAPKSGCFTLCGSTRNRLVVLAKKRFLPLRDHLEQLDIDSLTALKYALMANNALEEGDDNKFQSKVLLMENALSKAAQNIDDGEPSASLNMSRSFA